MNIQFIIPPNVVRPQLYVFSIENKHENRWKAIYSRRLTLFLFPIKLTVEHTRIR